MRSGPILVLPAVAIGLLAQTFRVELRGRVTDPAGAAVAGAKVAAGNETSLTSGAGEFALSLRAGEQTLEVDVPGFRPFRQRLQLRQDSAIDVRLQLGPAAESVRVTAEAPVAEAVAEGLIVEAEAIQSLPLRDGNPLALVDLAPGVVNLAEGLVRPYDNEGASQFAIHGATSGTHDFVIDSAPNTGGAAGTVAHIPPAGAVAELRVNASPFDARNGFSSGGNVALTLASGANKLHGSVAWYHENPLANANSFFSNRSGSGKDRVRENRPSVTATGPLVRRRAYWMLALEKIDASQPYRSTNLAYTVPTAAERQGDLSDLLPFGASYQVYDPKTTRPAATAGRYTRTPFPGNVIPSSRLDPVALELISRYYPAPNLSASKPTGVNYTTPSLQANEFWNGTARIDHTAGARHRLMARAAFSDRAQDLEARFNGGAGIRGKRSTRSFGADEMFAASPQALLNARYNYTRYVDNFTPFSAGLDLAGLGFSQTYVDQIRGVDERNLMLPDISPAGYAELNPHVATRLSSDIHAGALEASRVGRSHTLRAGAEHRVYRDASGNTGRSSGRLNFNTNWTRGPQDNSAASPIGQGLASLLLGLPTDGSMEINPSLAQQYSITAWHLQDTWRARPRLTVTYGVRWEYEWPLTERFNRSVARFDPDLPLPVAPAVQAQYAKSPSPLLAAAAFQPRGGLTFAGVDGRPRELWRASGRNWAPRVALAWSPRAKVVVRAGYGLFYDLARQNAIQTGFSRTTTLVASQDTGQTYVASLASPFPGGFAQPTGASLGAMTNAGQGISAFPDRLLNPYQQRWELALQRTVGAGSVVEVAYVGNRGVHLRVPRQLDPVPQWRLSRSPVRDNAVYGLLTANVANPFYPRLPSTSLASSTVAVSQLLRPYPQFTSVMSTVNDGYSWYHGMAARLQRRFSRSITATAAYTWSKFMDATAFLNEGDPAPARTISAQDRPHRVVASGIWRWRRGLQFTTVFQRQSGAPLNFGNVLYYGGDLHGPRTRERWFNTAPFEGAPAAQLVYNVRTFPLRVSDVRSMGLTLLDVGVMKSWRLRERLTFQLRADAFNSLNRTHFAAPNTSPVSTDFGAVAATSQMPRRIEFSGRLQF